MAGKAQTLRVGPHKSYIKCNIMTNQKTPFAELQKFRQHLVDGPGIDHHAVRNACQLCDLIGDRQLRIDKVREAVDDPPLHDLHSAKLDDPVLFRRKTGGLKIKDHDRPFPYICIQILFGNGHYALCQVIDQIAFNAIEDFEKVLAVDGRLSVFLAFFVGGFQQVFPHMSGVRKSLNIAVIRDGNGRHAPGISPFDNILTLRDTVHITHLGMAVQLNAFYRGVVHSRRLKGRDLHDALDGGNDNFLVKSIHDGRAAHLHESAFAKVF